MKSHGKVLCLLMSVCFIAATATAAFAQAAGATTGKCAFQKLSFPPPATDGFAVALNDLGGIAGNFVDKTGSHGFLLYQGRLTTFKFPGSVSTIVSDMSRNGIIVGQYFSADGERHAFMVHAGGFRTITLPGFPNADVTVNGVNSNGDVVGNFTPAGGPGLGPAFLGFLLHKGKLTILSFPGATQGTVAKSINDEGVIVGNYFIASVVIGPGFIWKDGVFSNINPGSVEPPFLDVTKISNSGVVVGSFEAANFTSHGFALENGTSTTIDVPGSSEVIVLAVNKFDNILIQADLVTEQGLATILFKGFCAATF